jgi:RNA polymerase sigma factor (sigma-70 family)
MASKNVQKFSPGENEPAGPGACLSGLTDEELMSRVAGKGDEAACTLLVERWTGPILARCYWITRDAAIAEEITQETFMRIWRSRHTWTHTRSFGAWVWQICGNRSFDAMSNLKTDAVGHIAPPDRKQGEEPEDRLAEIPDTLPPIPVEYRIAIAECMQTLRSLDRRFLELKFWKDMSVVEIGKNLLNTNDPREAEYKIHTIKARAYKALRKCLVRKGKADIVFPESDPSDALGAAGAPKIAGAGS